MYPCEKFNGSVQNFGRYNDLIVNDKVFHGKSLILEFQVPYSFVYFSFTN